MRIISGTARGRKLREPQGYDIRPTSDMVKESVFNIIQFDIEGRRVLDLFAGTGQLGIEALSRGAREAVFVDTKPDAAKLIRENLRICGFQDGTYSVYQRDAIDFIKSAEAFDLIFLDPPYDTPFVSKALSKIIEFDKLRENGIIICETRADIQMPETEPPYFKMREYRYGGIKITKYGKTDGFSAGPQV